MKVILVVGPSQSGSTLLFNMIRILLKIQGYKVDSCWYTLFKRGDFIKDADFIIVKCHFYDPDLQEQADIVFLPLRDFRDSAVSCHKRYKTLNEPSDYVEFILQDIGQFESWYPHATYIFKYEDYMENKELIMSQVLINFGIPNNAIDYSIVLEELDILHKGIGCPETDILAPEYHDKLVIHDTYRTTLTTKSHNTSGGKVGKYLTDIPFECLQHIESNEIIYNFLKNHGYHLSHSYS